MIKIPPPHSLEMSFRIGAIRLIFREDERLMYFLFSHKRLELRVGEQLLLSEAAEEFALPEQILIRSAMDMWNGSGRVRLTEILEILDADELLGLIHGVMKFREIELPGENGSYL